MRPQGDSQETPGRVQPHLLLRESVTSGDLHKPEPCFILPDEDPAVRHTLVPSTMTGNQDDAKGQRGR